MLFAMNIKLVVAYDGTDFFGWQASIDGETIEAALQRVLEKIYQHPIALQAASRTDRGVHAARQVVNYKTEKELDLDRLLISLNQLLPETIRVLEAKKVEERFHPTLDAQGKIYHYHLCTGGVQSPFRRHFSWHIHTPLDLSLMREGASHFLGTRDFASLTNAQEPRPNETVRTLRRLDIFEVEGGIRFEVEGDNFLYKMVRNLVGTLVYLGQGKLTLEEVRSLLKRQDRTYAGVTAPARGLTLFQVIYN
ncbi:MAG: tRNA pseudouridine(38-40) synthase TruA [Chlamydiia bacterium]|nr:tRNA pseudouridine(38-40) synthase TruA [Chlamydiia bacterium]